MKDFISSAKRMILLLVLGITVLCGYAGGVFNYHYVSVRSCDSAKGLVYADTTTIQENPTYTESVDLKWVDEDWDPIEERPDKFYSAIGYAQPKAGYVFTGWSLNDTDAAPFSYNNPETFASEADTKKSELGDDDNYPSEPDDVFYAHFGKVACDVDPESKANNFGAVELNNPSNMPGDEVILTATSWADNVYFKTWTKDGAPYSSDNPLLVIAQEEPATYYAVFDSKNKVEFNFNSEGEWKLHYNKSMDAHLPTAADGAYLVAKNQITDSYYRLVKVDTLKAGTPYLVHGAGNGTIEYFNHDPNQMSEVESALEYASEDIEIYASYYDPYCVLDLETLEFTKLDRGTHTLPQGTGYLMPKISENEVIKCLGVINDELKYKINTYYCVDYVNGTEGKANMPTSLTMTYDKYNGRYNVTKFFDFDSPKVIAYLVDGSLTEVEMPIYYDGLKFNTLLSETGDIADDGCDIVLQWMIDLPKDNGDPDDDEEDLYNGIRVTTENGTKYSMTPFYIYLVHDNLVEWTHEWNGEETSFTKWMYISDISIYTGEEPPHEVESITLDRTQIFLLTGESDRLIATVTPDNATDRTVVWTTTNADIVDVDQEGNIKAGDIAGYAYITATCGNASATCEVDVDFKHVTQIILDKTDLTLNIGEKAHVKVTYIPEDAFIKDVLWKSTDESVATVEWDGWITAVGVGEADIVAKSVFSYDKVTATCHVTVVDGEGGISDLLIDSLESPADIYTLQGVLVRRHSTDLGGLPRGFYIINGQIRYIK